MSETADLIDSKLLCHCLGRTNMYKLTDAINTQSAVKLHVRWQDRFFVCSYMRAEYKFGKKKKVGIPGTSRITGPTPPTVTAIDPYNIQSLGRKPWHLIVLPSSPPKNGPRNLLTSN